MKSNQLATKKSDLLNKLANNYPNFIRKDLNKLVDILINEMSDSLKRGERVELRGFGIFSTNIQKARISRNPKTNKKIDTPEKKTIHFKMSKDLFKILNDEKK